MGVYIKDMDMPLACYNEYEKIVCWHFNDCEAAQNATADALGMCTGRLDDCPLVEVPSADGWISCKERSPEKGGRYLCTIEITRDFVAEPFKKSRVLGIVGYSDMGDWVLMVYGAEVIAWRELGEPYKGE